MMTLLALVVYFALRIGLPLVFLLGITALAKRYKLLNV